MAGMSRRDFIRVSCGAGSMLLLGSEAIGQGRSKEVEDEVRYEMLRPAEMKARRDKCPVAYLPIGTLEWHGEHNPLGLDALKAHGLVVECAKRGGGVVFPPLFYGENRSQAHVDPDTYSEYGVPKENFGPDFTPYSIAEQSGHYHKLLIHIFNEIASLGFRFIIVCAGHYPLLDHARGAMSVFRQTARRWAHQPTTGWVFTGYELVGNEFPKAGDHGGPWETSIMMALDKDSVDVSLLPENKRNSDWVKEISPEYGKKAVDTIVERVLERVNDMLAHPGKCLGHYTTL